VAAWLIYGAVPASAEVINTAKALFDAIYKIM
jgi:hypothetical protein